MPYAYTHTQTQTHINKALVVFLKNRQNQKSVDQFFQEIKEVVRINITECSQLNGVKPKMKEN